MQTEIAFASTPLALNSRRGDVLGQILLAIFRGELPTGTRLKVLHLASQFGVSSTPIREAIVELAGLGVVEMYPNRGAVVAPFGVREIREIYLVRRLLEVECARSACTASNLEAIEQVTEETFSLLTAARGPEWISACVKNDRSTHFAIAQASGISRLQAELARYDRLMHIVRSLLKGSEQYLDNILQEHLGFLEAIIRRDVNAAGDAMARHLNATCDRVVEGLFLSRESGN